MARIGDCVFLKVTEAGKPTTGVIQAISTEGNYLIETPDGNVAMYPKCDIEKPKPPKNDLRLKPFIKMLVAVYEELGDVPVNVGLKPICGISTSKNNCTILI